MVDEAITSAPESSDPTFPAAEAPAAEATATVTLPAEAPDARPEAPAFPPLAYLRRALVRPRPWLLFYALTLLPALLIAPLLALPLLSWSRSPLFRELLATRSLDTLFHFLTGPMAESGLGPVMLLGMVLAVLAWFAVRLLWLWVEGGALLTYAADAPPTWGEFARAGLRWFGPFLLLNLLGVMVVAGFGALALGAAALLEMVLPALSWLVGGVGLALAGALATWVELARTAAFIHDERNIFRALGLAARAVRARFLPLALLVVGGLALFGVLTLVQRWLTRLIPVPWWLPSLVVQQALLIARLGVRLARQAGQVGVLATLEPLG